MPAGYYVYHGTSVKEDDRYRPEGLTRIGLSLDYAAPASELSPRRAAGYTIGFVVRICQQFFRNYHYSKPSYDAEAGLGY